MNHGDSTVLLDRLNLGFFRATLEGRILESNPAFARLLGVGPTEAGRINILDIFVRPEEREETLRRLQEGETLNDWLVDLQRPDGSVVTVSMTTTVVEDAGERVIVGVPEDVGDRRNSADRLSASEAELRTLLGALTDVILVMDADGRYLKVAASGPDLLYRPAEELLGRTVHELFPAETAAMFVDGIRRALATRQPQQAEYRLPIRGREVWFSAVVAPMLEDQVVFIARDITERKLAEVALRQAVSLLNATLDSTADGLLVVDDKGAMVSFNRKFTELWRIPEEILRDRDDAQALQFVLDQLAEPEAFLAKVRQLYSDPAAESFDVLHFLDGRIFERYSKPQLIDGTVMGRVWSFRDVTEHRNLEDQLRQAVKMEAVGRLAGGIAHDFNNLLTAVIGSCELLAQELPQESPSQEDVGEIRRAADRAVSLTRQLLAFSRRQVMRPRVMNPNEVVEDAQRLLGRLIGEHIELVIELERDPGRITADPAQLEQILMNLAVNARDAMPEGGALTIRTRAGPPPGAWRGAPERCVILEVSDTGIGMSADTVSHIFEPFFTTKPPGKGTGLGLATVYGIVKQSGGYITATSEPGKGATFEVFFPLADHPAEAPPEVPARIQGARGTGTILLVEDEAAVRRLAVRALRDRGYEVLEAANGEQALVRALECRHPLSLLVSDVVMPGLSGPALAERLRENLPALKVLYMSGYAPEELAATVTAEHFLPKPFTPDDLVAMVALVLGSSNPPEAARTGP